MIDERDRDSLIEFRLNQAFDTIELTRFLVSSDKFCRCESYLLRDVLCFDSFSLEK